MNIVCLSENSLYRFAVFEERMLNENNELFTSRYVVLKNNYNIVVSFTGLEKYSGRYIGRNRPIEIKEKHDLEYICMALNYIIFVKRYVDKVSRITKEHIFEFYDHYRSTRIDNGRFPGQQSIGKCVGAVTSFFSNMSNEVGSLAATNPDELAREEWIKRNPKSQKVSKIFVPIYQKKSLEKTNILLLRDIPKKAVNMLIREAYTWDQDIAFPIIAEITSGIRPGEAMNVRRVDSPLGAGINFEYIGSRVNKIDIDLSHEYLLRSDGIQTGKIKKERIATVYPPFMGEFLNAYNKHMYYLKGREYEKEYGPMFISRNGMAMTYKTYLQRFQSLVKDHLRPLLINSEDPLLQIFGQRLLTEDLSPHALRHYFSVVLALKEDVSQIMFFRGDSSPESALHYFQNKGELLKATGLAHNEALEGLIKLGSMITDEPDT